MALEDQEAQANQPTPQPASSDLSTKDQPPGTTRIEDGVAYDIKGNALGKANVPADDSQEPDFAAIAAKHGGTPDFAAIAAKHGGSAAQPSVDFGAIAAKHGGSAAEPQTTKIGGMNVADALVPAYLRNDPNFLKLSPDERKALIARRGRGTNPTIETGMSADEAQQVHSDRVRDTVADFLENVRDGAAGNFAGGVEGASKIAATGLRKLGAHKLADEISNPNGTGLLNNLSDADEHARGVGGAVGVASENILEFFAGDEALKALGEGFGLVKMLGKENIAAQIGKWAKANPFKAATLSAAITGIRQGTVTGAQELAHGADVKTAAWSALMNAGMGGMFDAFGSMSQAGSKLVRAAGKTGTAAAAGTWGVKSLYDALLPRQEGESEQEAINRRVSAAAGVVMAGDAIDPKSIYEHSIDGMKSIYDGVRGVKAKAGVSTDVAELFKRAVGKYGKQGAEELLDTANRTKEDLTAILNKNQGSISDLNDVGTAIDDHMKEVGDKPLMEKAKTTQDEVRPVTPNFRVDAEERLDQFFKDNAGRYTPEQEESLRAEFNNRVSRPHDLGNGTEIPRDPNLFEAENARRTMSEDAFSRSDSSSAKDGADARSRFLHEMADFMREKIDEGYEQRGVKGVKEFRSKEADLINLRDAAWKAQDAFEKAGVRGILGRFGAKVESALVYGAILAHITGGNIIGTVLGANKMWKDVQKFNTTDMHTNLERLVKESQKNKTAQATAPKFGPEAPMVGAPGGPEGPTLPFLGVKNPPVEGPQGPPPTPRPGAPGTPGGPAGPQNIPPGFPPRPEPPEPTKPPAVDHDVYATLATFFRHWKGDPSTPPYEVLLQQFKDHAANVQNFADNASDPNFKGPKYTPEQIEKVDRIQHQVNKAQAASDKFVEKQNAANQAKYQSDVRKWEDKLRAEQAKALQAQNEEAEKARQGQKTASEQRQDEIVAALQKDERVAHGPVMQATEPAAAFSQDLGSHTTLQAYRHDYGHIMTAIAEGLDPIDMVAEGHDAAKEWDAALLTRVDAKGLKPGAEGVFQHIVFLLGGAAFDKVHHDMAPHDNPGAIGDIREARKIAREKLGLTPDETNKVIDKLMERAEEHVSNPEALSIVDANAPLRESNLHPNWAVSRGRMKDLATKMRGVYGGQETKAGTTATGSERTPDGGDGGTTGGGRKGSKQAGNVEGVSSGEVRNADKANGEAGTEGRGKTGTAAKAGDRAGSKVSDSAEAKPGGSDTVTVYHGEGGAAGGGRGGAWWTTNAKRAASYGGEVTTVDVPRDEFEAGQKAAFEQGSGTKGDAILDMKWHDKAKKADVEPDVYELGDESSAAFTPGKPKERSTGDEATDVAIKKGGGVPGGVQKGFEHKGKKIPDQVYFHDPITGTSMNLPVGEATPERVKSAIMESRKKYGIDEEPEEYVSAGMTASPKDQAIVDRATWELNPNTGYRRLRLHDESSARPSGMIGYISHDARPGEEYGRVRLSSLDEGFENRGIGKAMYERAFSDAQAQGVRQLKSDTSLSPNAERVWKSMMASGKYKITVQDLPNEVNRGKPAPFTHNEYTIHFPEEEPEMERLRRTGPATREATPPTKEEIEGAEERRERREAERRVEASGLFGNRKPKDVISAAFQKPETQEWFKGSKVVDEKGEPLRVYHGTRASEDFETFETEGRTTDESGEERTSGSGADPTSYMGAHFAVEPEVANKFAVPPRGSWMASRYEEGEEKPRVIPAYLSLKNPKDFGSEKNLRDFINEGDLSRSGYDGDEMLNRAMEADGIANPEDGGDAVDKWMARYAKDKEFRREQNRWIIEAYRPEEGEEDSMHSVAEDLGQQAKSRLQEMGHDGMKYKNEVEGGTAYTAFKPEQIRAAIPESGR